MEINSYKHSNHMKKCCRKNILQLVCKECDEKCQFNCLFFFEEPHSAESIIIIRSRICKKLYEDGYRVKTQASFELIKKIKENIHYACFVNKPLSIDEYFPITKIYEIENNRS